MAVVHPRRESLLMPFKKTKDGWVSDPKGDARIPSAKRNVFDTDRRTQVLDEFGHPVNADEEYWRKVIDEKNKEERS